MSLFLHTVSIGVDRGFQPVTLDRVEEFELTNDMLELADDFSMTLPLTRELWDAVKPDGKIELYIDDSKVLTGFIDRRERGLSRSGGSTITITGRDLGGRLVDESAPLQSYQGIGILQLAQAMAGDWFDAISLSNASNRQLIRGRARRSAKVSSEPVIDQGRWVSKKVEPGESRAQVLQQFLEEARLLAWSSADGGSFVVGLPNYSQAPQWRFFAPAAGSNRQGDGNVIEVVYSEDVGDRYAMITACGSSRGDSASYGPNVTRRRAQVKDGPNLDGTGGDFAHPKHLMVSDDDTRSAKMARERAEREMRLRDSMGTELEIVVPGWGQALEGVGLPAVYAFDTIAHYEDEEIGLSESFLVTQVQFRESRTEGQTSRLRLVPRGTELVTS